MQWYKRSDQNKDIFHGLLVQVIALMHVNARFCWVVSVATDLKLGTASKFS
jgi:hypothetical protein